MPNYIIALFVASGVSTWVYAKFYRSTGGRQQSTLIVAGTAFLFSFGIVWWLFNTVIPHN